jgi:hypothetical protein
MLTLFTTSLSANGRKVLAVARRYARASEVPFDALPNIAAWYERVERTEGWKATATPTWPLP